uniref:Uncharacterized protein n=1 Tax=Musa acuminata subsp. malaccensis TaxID=214687 RepID=A0A804L114_MUSAM
MWGTRQNVETSCSVIRVNIRWLCHSRCRVSQRLCALLSAPVTSARGCPECPRYFVGFALLSLPRLDLEEAPVVEGEVKYRI